MRLRKLQTPCPEQEPSGREGEGGADREGRGRGRNRKRIVREASGGKSEEAIQKSGDMGHI
jgi:hypothetical protein